MSWILTYGTPYQVRRRQGMWLLFAWIMFVIVLIVMLLILLIGRLFGGGVVYAASFYPSGDILYCDVVPALGVFIEDVAASSDIVYDSSAVVGYPSTDINVTHLKDYVDTRIGMARRLDRATFVALPPGGRLALGVFFYNFSGKSVPIHGVYVPFNSGVGKVGDLLHLAGVHLEHRNISFRYNRRLYGRIAEWGYFPLLLDLPNKVLDHGYKIGVFELRGGLDITGVKKDCELFPIDGGKVRIHMCVRNLDESGKRVGIYWGNNRVKEMNLARRGHLGDTACLDLERSFYSTSELLSDLGVVYVEDVEREECLSVGDNRGDSTNSLSRALLLWRGERGAPRAWGAPQPSFARVGSKGICIRRISYKLKKSLGICEFPRESLGVMGVQGKCTYSEAFALNIKINALNNTVATNRSRLIVKPINFRHDSVTPLSPNIRDAVGHFISYISLPQYTNKIIDLRFKPTVGSELYWIETAILEILLANNRYQLRLPRCITPKISVNEYCQDGNYIIVPELHPLESVARLAIELVDIRKVRLHYNDGGVSQHKSNSVIGYEDLKELRFIEVISPNDRCHKGAVNLRFLDRAGKVRYSKQVVILACACNTTAGVGSSGLVNTGGNTGEAMNSNGSLTGGGRLWIDRQSGTKGLDIVHSISNIRTRFSPYHGESNTVGKDADVIYEVSSVIPMRRSSGSFRVNLQVSGKVADLGDSLNSISNPKYQSCWFCIFAIILAALWGIILLKLNNTNVNKNV